LDFSRVLAGPYCTALLADLGADVVKVEPPAGDDYRHVGPFVQGESALFLAVNRGKRSIALDLSRPGDRDIAHALAGWADVVVENFRPGVADKLGIGWDAFSARNPRLVYASISGFGQKGPLAQRPAYDVILQAMSGIMSVTGEADGPPVLVGESIADIATGLFTSWAVLAALVERATNGKGRRIDMAMYDAMIALQPMVMARQLATGQVQQRMGSRHPSSAPFGAFRARDGVFVLAVLNDRLFARLAQYIGRPDLLTDARYASDFERFQNEQGIRDAIENWAGPMSAAEAVASLVAAGIPASGVHDMGEVLASPQTTARELLQEADHARLGRITLPQQPGHFLGTRRGGTAPPPALDGDREAILAELDFGPLRDAS
jgi:CoA:oxalate CoA-transferase